jgi:hypothetical protein
MQMENIAHFLEGAQKAGVPQHDLFQTVDLFEDKNRTQVVDAIWSLSRHAYKNGTCSTVSDPRTLAAILRVYLIVGCCSTWALNWLTSMKWNFRQRY